MFSDTMGYACIRLWSQPQNVRRLFQILSTYLEKIHQKVIKICSPFDSSFIMFIVWHCKHFNIWTVVRYSVVIDTLKRGLTTEPRRVEIVWGVIINFHPLSLAITDLKLVAFSWNSRKILARQRADNRKRQQQQQQP